MYKCHQHQSPSLPSVEAGGERAEGGKQVGEAGRQDAGQASKVVSHAYCQGQDFPSLWQEQRERERERDIIEPAA